jgi:hypothetical protein
MATVAAGALVLSSLFVLSSEANHLKVAKQDAFDSIVALSEARALSYDANANESRYLLDPSRAAEYEQSFLDRSQALASFSGVGLAQYDGALDTALKAYQANHAEVRFGGYFAAELKSIPFGGKREALEKVLTAYQNYQRDDRQVRALASRGDLRGAIVFDVATTPGNSNYDFAQYDKALVAVISLNQNAFDTAIRDGETVIQGWTDAIPLFAILLISALLFVGVRPRLAEYR